jgi:hypothetical protein
MKSQPNGGLPLQATSSVREGFAQYHGKRIAIVLMYRNQPTMFWGAAEYQDDELLGPALRIRLNKNKSPSETDGHLGKRVEGSRGARYTLRL